MGLIKEPKNVDFYVDPTPLSKQEMNEIHEAIAYYKATGLIMKQPQQRPTKKSLRVKRQSIHSLRNRKKVNH